MVPTALPLMIPTLAPPVRHTACCSSQGHSEAACRCPAPSSRPYLCALTPKPPTTLQATHRCRAPSSRPGTASSGCPPCRRRILAAQSWRKREQRRSRRLHGGEGGNG